jgi:hypothetical protein
MARGCSAQPAPLVRHSIAVPSCRRPAAARGRSARQSTAAAPGAAALLAAVPVVRGRYIRPKPASHWTQHGQTINTPNIGL